MQKQHEMNGVVRERKQQEGHNRSRSGVRRRHSEGGRRNETMQAWPGGEEGKKMQ
jgi:hypothetical protein